MSQTNAQLLADSLGTASTGTVPIGGIILWSGSTVSVPNGWALCNGGNGTPNLQDRFIVGAGNNYAVDAAGGSANAVLIGHSHGITDSGHRHTYTAATSIGGYTDNGGDPDERSTTKNDLNTNYSTTGISINANGINSSGEANSTQTGTNANLPPYYSLAYIMRTS